MTFSKWLRGAQPFFCCFYAISRLICRFVYAMQIQVIPVTPASVKTMAHQTPSMPSQSGRRYKRAPLITMPLRTVSTVDILVRMIDWK